MHYIENKENLKEMQIISIKACQKKTKEKKESIEKIDTRP